MMVLGAAQQVICKVVMIPHGPCRQMEELGNGNILCATMLKVLWLSLHIEVYICLYKASTWQFGRRCTLPQKVNNDYYTATPIFRKVVQFLSTLLKRMRMKTPPGMFLGIPCYIPISLCKCGREEKQQRHSHKFNTTSPFIGVSAWNTCVFSLLSVASHSVYVLLHQ